MIAADSEIIHDPVAYEKYEKSFPEFLIVDKISCYNEKQQAVYKELIGETISKYGGRFVDFTGKVQDSLMELWMEVQRWRSGICGTTPPDGLCHAAPSMLPGLREITRRS